jgi:hypothetical protein
MDALLELCKLRAQTISKLANGSSSEGDSYDNDTFGEIHRLAHEIVEIIDNPSSLVVRPKA